MSKGEMAYLALVLFSVSAFMIGVGTVSIWSNRGRRK